MVKRLKYFEPWWNNPKYVLGFCYGTSLNWDNQQPTRQSFTIWFSLQLLRVWKISLSVVRSISFYSTQSALFQKTWLDWLGLYIALRTRQKNNPAEIILWTRVHLPRHQADNFSEISAVTCLGWRGGRGGWGGEGGVGCWRVSTVASLQTLSSTGEVLTPSTVCMLEEIVTEMLPAASLATAGHGPILSSQDDLICLFRSSHSHLFIISMSPSLCLSVFLSVLSACLSLPVRPSLWQYSPVSKCGRGELKPVAPGC